MPRRIEVVVTGPAPTRVCFEGPAAPAGLDPWIRATLEVRDDPRLGSRAVVSRSGAAPLASGPAFALGPPPERLRLVVVLTLTDGDGRFAQVLGAGLSETFTPGEVQVGVFLPLTFYPGHWQRAARPARPPSPAPVLAPIAPLDGDSSAASH
jgi:hypothetical protein